MADGEWIMHGCSAVNSCDEPPEESCRKIRDQIRKHFPTADEAAVRKVIGIRK